MTVRLNVLGIDLNINQVDAILTNQDNVFDWQRNWLTSFFQLDSPSQLMRGVLTRYSEADSVMARISVGTNEQDIYDRLIDSLVSAKRCYSNAEYLACIELCALHGEMLANYLCITDKDRLEQAFNCLSCGEQETIISNKGSGIYFSDKLNQRLRLKWLLKAKILTSDDKERLLNVHKMRVNYFHHWSPKQPDEKQDALNILSTISPVTAKFLEILGSEPRTYNLANLERVKRYMKIVSKHAQVCNFVPYKIEPFCEYFSKLWHKFIKIIGKAI